MVFALIANQTVIAHWFRESERSVVMTATHGFLCGLIRDVGPSACR